MTKLNIIYPHGRMTINVENFLDDCGVTKFKKLVKIINMSYTPEAHIEILKNYIIDYLSSAKERTQLFIDKAESYEREISNNEQYLAKLIHKRNSVKTQLKKIRTYTTHKSQEYKLTKESEIELNNEIKLTREDLANQRAGFKTDITMIKLIERNNKNFKKYLELLKEV
jgi:hypothetical protein